MLNAQCAMFLTINYVYTTIAWWQDRKDDFSLTFSSAQLITSHFHLSLSLSPLELLDLLISSINYLTFSSTSLSLSPLELPYLFIPPINCTLNFLFKSYVLVPIILLLFESQRCILSPLVSDWLCRVLCFYLFLYLIFLFYSIFFFLAFGVLCPVGFMLAFFLF